MTTTPSKPQPKEMPSCAKHINPQLPRPPALRTTALPKRRPLPPSTEFDTMRQSPTNHNKNSCAHAREATAPIRMGGYRACLPARAASCTTRPQGRRGTCLPARARSVPSRHSREGGNPFSLHGLPKPQRVERIPWSCRPLSVMPIDRTDPARIYRHRATETARSRNPTGSHMRGRNTRARRRLTERSGWDMVAAALCEGAAKSAERPKAASSSYRLVVDRSALFLPDARGPQANERSVQCPINHRCRPRPTSGI